MAFDIFAAIMAVLSVLSFGLIGPADVAEETPQIEILSGVTDTDPEAAESDTPSAVSDADELQIPAVPDEPDTPPVPPAVPADKPGADLIAGTWKGSSSVPFVASMTFHAEVSADGTAQFRGTVDSSLFGDSTFDIPATWEYRGGTAFNTVVEGVDTPVACDGNTLYFQANPYKLGLVDNEMADRNFTIELRRV